MSRIISQSSFLDHKLPRSKRRTRERAADELRSTGIDYAEALLEQHYRLHRESRLNGSLGICSWDANGLIPETVPTTPEESFIELPFFRSHIEDMWASCDQRCVEDSRLCYHAQYRNCPVATNSTLVHCTCRAHVDCVVNLKSGFATMIEFISSVSAVVIVLMVTPLAPPSPRRSVCKLLPLCVHRRCDRVLVG